MTDNPKVDFDQVQLRKDLIHGVKYKGGMKPGTDVASLLEKNKAFQKLSLEDPLTHLPNSRAYENFIDRLTASWKRSVKKVGISENTTVGSVIAMDVSKLKGANDTYGNEAGDEYLKAVASTLLEHTREGDNAFRLGEASDEFVLVVRKVLEEADIESLMDRIDNSLSQKNRPLKAKYPDLEFSLSYSACRYRSINPQIASSRAINELRQAKQVKYKEGKRGERLDKRIII